MNKNKKSWITISIRVEEELVSKMDARVQRDAIEMGSTYNRSCVVRKALKRYLEF